MFNLVEMPNASPLVLALQLLKTHKYACEVKVLFMTTGRVYSFIYAASENAEA